MSTSIRLNPAIDEPINLKFADARLRDVLAFIGHATSVVFTGYDASFDESRSITIEATIDTTAPLESLLETLLTPRGLIYTVTDPRTVVIARNPLAAGRQTQAASVRERRQINKVYPEYPQDALERGIQGTVVVDITINPSGDVTTAALASGPQELHASAFKAALGLKYTPGPSTTALKIGFHYTLSGNSWGVRIADAQAPSNPDSTSAYRVGNGIQAPTKIKDVPPVYPVVAQAARVQGVVILEARIDENGNVSDARPVRSVPLLDQAAIDAVKEWQYTPTLMNGVAVPVIMTVTVNFSLRERLEMRVVLPDGNSMTLEMPSVGIVKREFAGTGIFQLRTSRERASNDATVSMFSEDGQTHLGDIVVTLGGPVVQSPTTPSLGIQFLGVR